MTFLHHAINTKSDEKPSFAQPAQAHPLSPLERSPDDEWSASLVETSEVEEAPMPVSNADLLDPWVPVVKSAFKFARASLWLPEVRCPMCSSGPTWLVADPPVGD